MSDSPTLAQAAIALDGRWLDGDRLRPLTGMRIQQRLSLPALCELYFRDPPGPLAFVENLQPGAALRVEIQGFQRPLFAGELTAVEFIYTPGNEREVYLRAYDPLHRLRKRQSVDVLSDDVSLEAALRELCRRADIQNLDVPGGGRPASGLHYPRLIAHQPTDLDFLAATARRAGLYLTMRGNTLHLVDLGGFDDPPLVLELGANLTGARFEVNADAACQAVEVQGWDLRRVKLHNAKAEAPRTRRDVPTKINVKEAGGDGVRRLYNQAAVDRDHARLLAQAELDRRSASEVVVWGQAAGHPGLHPGAVVEVLGVAQAVQGRYVLTETVHRFDGAGGYVTEFNSDPPASLPAPAPAATFGEVVDIGDPDGLGRVRVRLPAYGGARTNWTPVLFPGAGAGKGLVTLPDVGDTVLIILMGGDPAQGVVLGGVYGSERTPDSGVSLGRTRRYTLTTPGRQKVQLDDSGDVIRLENGNGTFIELAGGEITIAGKKIDFRQT